MTLLNDNWEFDVLGIYNYKKTGKLEPYYTWITNNHNKIDGHIAEVGVYMGKSLLATAMLLKELGSSKMVYGFDSFSGFPPVYHENDDFKMFEVLLREGRISSDHYEAHKKLKKYRSLIKNEVITVKNISSSTDFSGANLELVKEKIDLLGLDNIVLVQGKFSETMVKDNMPELKLMASLIDCDIYLSYREALPFIWQRMSPGAYLWLDEYYSLKFPGARIAADQFFSNLDEKPLMYPRRAQEFERWYVIKETKSVISQYIKDEQDKVRISHE